MLNHVGVIPFGQQLLSRPPSTSLRAGRCEPGATMAPRAFPIRRLALRNRLAFHHASRRSSGAVIAFSEIARAGRVTSCKADSCPSFDRLVGDEPGYAATGGGRKN